MINSLIFQKMRNFLIFALFKSFPRCYSYILEAIALLVTTAKRVDKDQN